MKERIKQLMESQHMTQQTFADFIGISSASLSSIFNDRTKPTLNTVEAIRNKFPTISLDWLMYGKGVMFLDDVPDVTNVEDTHYNNVSEQSLQFDEAVPSANSQPVISYSSSQQREPYPSRYPTSGNRKVTSMNFLDKSQRNITEIRIFFDDQTWETFVPKK